MTQEAAKKILVTDDEPDVLSILERILSSLGYVVKGADTWQKSLELFKAGLYDLAILDVHMPGKDGFHLAKEMREIRPEQKILIITGLGAGDVFKYFSDSEVDINGILYKPFSVNKVRQIVAEVLGSMPGA